MNAYIGTEPYVFFSYAHSDREVVEKIIIGLKQKMCRIWYDEGLTPGESWNDDLAEHLKNSEIVVILLTKNSMGSQYVKAEINYAISKQIKILPVMLENITLPSGLEMMLSSVQYAILYDESDINKQIAKLSSNLPGTVFATKKSHFLKAKTIHSFLKKI